MAAFAGGRPTERIDGETRHLTPYMPLNTGKARRFMTDSDKLPKMGTDIIASGIARNDLLDHAMGIDRLALKLAGAGSLGSALQKAAVGIGSLSDPSLASVGKSIRDIASVTGRPGMHESVIEQATRSAASFGTSSGMLGHHRSVLDEAMKSIAQISDYHSVFARPKSAIEEAMKSVASLSTASQIGRHSGAAEEAMKTLGVLSGVSQIGRYSSGVEEAMKSLGGVSAFARGSPLSRALDTAGVLSGAFDRAVPRGILEEMKKADCFDNFGALASSSGAMDAARKTLGLDLGGIGALTRSRQWAETLSGHSSHEIGALLGASGIADDQFEQLRRAATSIMDATRFVGADSLVGRASIGSVAFAGLEATSLKLSLFASVTDIFGPDASGSAAAFTSLMGNYRSRLDFEPSFWRDPVKRARVYHDADVDDGLIDADNARTLEVLVGSGVVEGRVGRSGSIVAVIEAGPMRMRITAAQTRFGAYRAIDAFEISLRAFVAAKLEEAHGPLWFKQRVPGDVAGRAKDRKREAMRSGETAVHPIHFVDLGDLIPIILRKDNWSETFEAVFQRSDWLKVDLERLTAIRRPIMHARTVDGVQLCEMVLTIRKLASWMEKDGSWDNGWNDDV